LALALAAAVLAAAGSAFAASGGTEVRAAPVAGLPDTGALVAQARDAAERVRGEVLLALEPSMAFIANEFGNPREIVKNAPYTAEAVTERIQVLPDGNRIVRKSTALLARDGVGRTRQERNGDGRSGIYIYDPIDGRSIVLNDASKTATRVPRVPMLPEPPMPPRTGAAPMPPVPPVPPIADGDAQVEVQPGRVVVRRKGMRADDGSIPQEDVRAQVIRIGGDERMHAVPPAPPAPPLPPLTLPLLPRGKGETKLLGTREFDGVKADGTVTTHTIPAGAIGNERPIVVASERWFSPELHVVVFAKTTGPRVGETVYRLTNVKRAEPPADLFKVPADYRMRGEGRRS
jgi:hypothetical protein